MRVLSSTRRGALRFSKRNGVVRLTGFRPAPHHKCAASKLLSVDNDTLPAAQRQGRILQGLVSAPSPRSVAFTRLGTDT